MTQRFTWGHININVRNLDKSVMFYELLGFTRFLPSIPYLNLSVGGEASIPESCSKALGLEGDARGRACIMQLDDGFPKLDLTEFAASEQRDPLANGDLGVVRICLISQNLQEDYERLLARGVTFLTSPAPCHERLADVAVCRDPDGTLIELLQVYLDRWGPYLEQAGPA